MNRLYTVLIFIAILSMCVYMFFVASRPQYVTHTTLLLMPESEQIGSYMERVTADVAFIMQESMRDDAMLAKHGVIVSIETVKGANMISVNVFVKNISVARSIEEYVQQTILQKVRQYYQVDDLAIKVVRQDVVPQKTIIAEFVPYMVMICIALGLIAGVFALFHYIEQIRAYHEPVLPIDGKKIFEKFHNSLSSFSLTDKNTQVDNVIEKNDVIETPFLDENVVINEVNVATEEDVKITQQKTIPAADIAIPDGISATPGNLPIVDVSALGFARSKKETSEVHAEEYNEPTEEELKARLNALLSGKL